MILALAMNPPKTPSTIVRCQFAGMPPMILSFFEGRDGLLKVGKSKPVPLAVGSSLSTATYGAQEFTLSPRLPMTLTVSAPGNDTKTYGGRCDSNHRD